MRLPVRLGLASLFLLFAQSAWSDDDEPLTQTQVLGITAQAKAEGQETMAEPPKPIKPLSKEDRKELKERHRVVSGKNWRALSPQQRDDMMRSLRAANAPGTIFVIDVRTGDVYRFDALPEIENKNVKDDERISEEYDVNLDFFETTDFVELQVAVGPDDSSRDETRGSVGQVRRGPREVP